MEIDNKSISQLLSTDGFICVNKLLIKKLGLNAAVVLGELLSEYSYWSERNLLDNDMFYSTRENIEENTGLNEYYQRQAISTLKEKGILEVVKKGIPAKNYYKIVYDKLLNLLSSSPLKFKELEVQNLKINNNKQTKITNKNKDITNSKELVENSSFLGSATKSVKKESLYSKCINLIDNFTESNSIRELLIQYLNLRLEMKDKPMYTNQWKGLLNKLEKLEEDNNIEAVIRQSIEKGYASFYPVNNYTQSKKDKFSEGSGLSCEQYTEEELAEIKRRADEREANGQRGYF